MIRQHLQTEGVEFSVIAGTVYFLDKPGCEDLKLFELNLPPNELLQFIDRIFQRDKLSVGGYRSLLKQVFKIFASDSLSGVATANLTAATRNDKAIWIYLEVNSNYTLCHADIVYGSTKSFNSIRDKLATVKLTEQLT